MAIARRRTCSLLLGAVLVLLAITSCSSSGDGGQQVPFDADDGTVLRGRLISGQGVASVLLIHDFGSSQRVWSKLAEALVKRGITVFTYDMRGHESSPGKREIGVSDLDATAALRMMRNSIRLEQIFIIGEGAGAITALRVASREQILGVVSVSAPQSFRGTSAINDVSRIDAPKLFIAAEGDEQGAKAAHLLHERSQKPSNSAVFPGDSSGAKLLNDNREAQDLVLDFIDQYRPG